MLIINNMTTSSTTFIPAGTTQNALLSDTDKMDQFVKSNLGFAIEDVRERNMMNALTHPDVYMKDRQKAREKMEETASKEFRTLYEQFISQGYPEQIAQSAALQGAKSVAAISNSLVEQQFPNVFAGLALQQQSKKELGAINRGFNAFSLMEKPALPIGTTRRKTYRKRKSRKSRK